MPKDLVLGTPGYDDMEKLEAAISRGQPLCEEACVPLRQFFATAHVAHVKRMPIYWNKQEWYGSQFENEHSDDVQLIAGVSPAGFFVGVYVIALHSY